MIHPLGVLSAKSTASTIILNEKIKNRFNITDLPYFKIIISSFDGNLWNIHPLSLGRTIHKNKLHQYSEMKQISKIPILASFNRANHANKFLDSRLSDFKLKSYIPFSAITKQKSN